MQSIGIIGGGITGLTTAFNLSLKDFEVSIYEKQERVGGVIRSYREDGWLAEGGPHTLMETNDQIRDLVSNLNLEGERLYGDSQSKKRFIVRNKTPQALPSSLGSFLSTKLFTTSAKLRLLKEPFISRWDNSEEESLAHFVKRRLGQEFLDYAINPFVAGVYAGDPEQLSVKQAFGKLYELEQKYGSLIKGQIKGAKERKKRAEVSKQKARLFSFREGIETLPRAIQARLSKQIILNAEVAEISKKGQQWEITYRKNGTIKKAKHDIVLYTGPIYALSDITFGHKDIIKPMANEIYYPPVSALTLGFRRMDVNHPLDGFGMLIPEKENCSILGTLFTSTLFPGRAPDGHVTLASFIGGARNPTIAGLPKEELVELTMKDLHTILGLKGDPVFIHHVHWEKAIPQYTIGYGLYKQKMDNLESDNPGFYMSGNYRFGISVSDCITAGYETADRIKEFLSN
jgi:oxygen-dependent protoporphyrinogen oxidase